MKDITLMIEREVYYQALQEIEITIEQTRLSGTTSEFLVITNWQSEDDYRRN